MFELAVKFLKCHTKWHSSQLSVDSHYVMNLECEFLIYLLKDLQSHLPSIVSCLI